LLQIGESRPENFFEIVSPWADSICTDKVDQNMFVHEDPTKASQRNWPAHRHDLLNALVRPRGIREVKATKTEGSEF